VLRTRVVGRWIGQAVSAFALRVEDRWQSRRLRRLLRSEARLVRVQPFPAFGTTEWARIRGRVLLASAPLERRPRPTTWTVIRANLLQFLTTEVPHARVRIDLTSGSIVAVADREGYFDVLLEDIDQLPGRHAYTVTPIEPPGPSATGTLHVPDPNTDLVVVTDIDDTIIDSGIARGVVAVLATALLRDSATRVPLEGAVELARSLASGGDREHERPFVYLSTSPWNLVEFLLGFLDRHGFPPGPLVLTDWGPSEAGLLRISTRSHKLAALRVLSDALPQARFILIGDSGQEDPEIYGTFALEHPRSVAAVFIRRARPPHPEEDERLASWSRKLREHSIPVVIAADATQMLADAARLGLVRRDT
jgi:phosphatidate phosphatase APP1